MITIASPELWVMEALASRFIADQQRRGFRILELKLPRAWFGPLSERWGSAGVAHEWRCGGYPVRWVD